MADYCTAQNVADHLLESGLMDGGTREALLTRLATVASRLIDKRMGKPDSYYSVSAATARYFDGNGTQEIWPGEMAEAPTEVAVAETGDLTDYTVWAASDYFTIPYNAPSLSRPYQGLVIDLAYGTKSLWPTFRKCVKITAKWGWSTSAPAMVAEAAMIQVARWYKRGEQAFQDAGAVTELMSMRYLKKMDPDVEVLLALIPGGVTI